MATFVRCGASQPSWREWRSSSKTTSRLNCRFSLFVCYRYRCRQIPAFCDDTDWPVLEWEMLFDQNGDPLGGESQGDSWFYTPEDREGEVERGVKR